MRKKEIIRKKEWEKNKIKQILSLEWRKKKIYWKLKITDNKNRNLFFSRRRRKKMEKNRKKKSEEKRALKIEGNFLQMRMKVKNLEKRRKMERLDSGRYGEKPLNWLKWNWILPRLNLWVLPRVFFYFIFYLFLPPFPSKSNTFNFFSLLSIKCILRNSIVNLKIEN